MKDLIITKLKELENEYSIKILYACEAGSRAWGLHSNKSDYDVRFIYVLPPSYYLSIDPVGIGKKKDVIDVPIHHSLDMHGFELTKALRLFRKSNPNILEWLHSELIYYKAFHTIDKMLEIEPNVFQSKSCIHHYLNMAKRNFHIIEERNEKNVKQYIQVIRPILIAKWIDVYQTFPRMQMETLVNAMTELGPDRERIHLLINAKKKQQDFLVADSLNNYVKRELDLLEHSAFNQSTKSFPHGTERLDNLFRETLKECWP